MTKRRIVIALVVMLVFGIATVFASGGKEQASDGLSGTITFTIWDNNLNDFIEANDMVGKFKESYPNADIEVEKIKDDSEYWNSMKMRASANQLPDVMFNKPFTLSRFKDFLLDLSGTEAAKNNLLASGYAIDGKILGIPMTSGYEYVFYWKDLFREAGVEVPTTWPQFVETAKKLQQHYGKNNPDFMALGVGLKDEWPDYPFMEFMPALISGNGQNW
ncbi:MAG: ABC transporter substrate-binding protein, partial [Sphaerochaetaceae bacterium]